MDDVSATNMIIIAIVACGIMILFSGVSQWVASKIAQKEFEYSNMKGNAAGITYYDVVTKDYFIKVRLRPQQSLNVLTVTHEYAHVIYHEVLSEQQRKEWDNLHYNTSYFVTQYSKTNPSEDFAESFAYLTLYNSSIGYEKETFIRGIIENIQYEVNT